MQGSTQEMEIVGTIEVLTPEIYGTIEVLTPNAYGTVEHIDKE